MNARILLRRSSGTRPSLSNSLEAAGATSRDVVKTRVYVVPKDRSHLSDVWGVAQELGMADAASTLLGVSVLGYEGRLVEIEAIAVLD